MAASSSRVTWRDRLAAWLATPANDAEVERITRAAEQWAADAKADRLVRRLASARAVPGVHVDPDWRETCGASNADQPPSCAGDA